MDIETNIFTGKVADFQKLQEYGFVKEKDSYQYTKVLDNFQVIITVNNGCVTGKIIDLSLNEEYYNFRNYTLKGFALKIREEYIKILEDINVKCFSSNYFYSNQANRVTNLIYDKYQNKPEFLWKKYPHYGVFKNKKWYAIIMQVVNENREVEVINVKLDKEKIKILLTKKGFLRAYHMNKENWISIVLDETISDLEIMAYVSESYLLTN